MKIGEAQYIKPCKTQISYVDNMLTAQTNIIPELPDSLIQIGNLGISFVSDKYLFNYLDVYTNSKLWREDDRPHEKVNITDVSWVSLRDPNFDEARMEMNADFDVFYNKLEGMIKIKIARGFIPDFGLRISQDLCFIVARDLELCDIWIKRRL